MTGLFRRLTERSEEFDKNIFDYRWRGQGGTKGSALHI